MQLANYIMPQKYACLHAYICVHTYTDMCMCVCVVRTQNSCLYTHNGGECESIMMTWIRTLQPINWACPECNTPQKYATCSSKQHWQLLCFRPLSVCWLFLLLLGFNLMPAAVACCCCCLSCLGYCQCWPPTQFFIFIYAFDSCVAFTLLLSLSLHCECAKVCIVCVCECVCVARLIVQSAASSWKFVKCRQAVAASYLRLAFYYDSHIHTHVGNT